MSSLLSWLEEPSSQRGIRFATRDDWTLWTYEQLAELARTCAAALAEAGVRPGGRVNIIEENGPHFVGLFFGALLAGATPSPVAPRPAFGDRQRYTDHLIGVLRATEPDLVVHAAGLDLPSWAPAISTPTLLEGAAPSDVERPRASLALLQFTSGTTGNVKGIRVPYPALEANIRAIANWLEMTPEDPTASWLPVHHDMGLVGCLLAPIASSGDLWLMSPGDFVRSPLRYLRCFGELGARLTAMPAFGLDHIVRRVRPQALAGMDFSQWRAVIVGAERVSPGSLERFAALGAPHGLSRTALLPAYGLAEATLAVTGLPLRTGWQSVARDDSATPRTATPPGQGAASPPSRGAAVPPSRGVTPQLRVGGENSGRAEVVGCGRPVAGARVWVVDDLGEPVPEGVTGEIVVGGDSVADGGEVMTGDAGFLHNGQLFVLGRLGDSVKIRGRALFAEDIDAAITAAHPDSRGRVATVLGVIGETTHVVAIFERPEPGWLDTAVAAAKVLAEDADIETISVPSGAIRRTSSGKPRRRELWRAYLAGELNPFRMPSRTEALSCTK